MSRKKEKKNAETMTIFEEQKKSKLTAKKVLENVQKAEKQKLKEGYSFILLSDGKTRVLRKIK